MKKRNGSVITSNVRKRIRKKKKPEIITFFEPILSTIHPNRNTEKTIEQYGRPLSNPVRI
jgi:hypothetical protein